MRSGPDSVVLHPAVVESLDDPRVNIIGIDPGLTGAIALLHPIHLSVYDIPVEYTPGGKGRQICVPKLHGLVGHVSDFAVVAVMERVRAMPRKTGGREVKMGAQSMFNFGDTFGCLRTVAELGIASLTIVEPAVWKRRAGLIGKDKDAARELAIELFPELADQLKRKKDHGRAEALLIARFGVSHYESGGDLL